MLGFLPSVVILSSFGVTKKKKERKRNELKNLSHTHSALLSSAPDAAADGTPTHSAHPWPTLASRLTPRMLTRRRRERERERERAHTHTHRRAHTHTHTHTLHHPWVERGRGGEEERGREGERDWERGRERWGEKRRAGESLYNVTLSLSHL